MSDKNGSTDLHEQPSIEQVVDGMASILAEYLNADQIKVLTQKWRQDTVVSVKMLQQSVLDCTTYFPHLKPHKSAIRRSFWAVIQDQTLSEGEQKSLNEQQQPNSETVAAFYSVIEAIKSELSAPDCRNFFHDVHRMVAKDRTLKGHSINMAQFLEGVRPVVPDDVNVLNNVVQLVYMGLCDFLGPVEADDILYRSAEVAQLKYPKATVQQLF